MSDVSWHESRRIAAAAAGPLPAHRVSLSDAVERVLAEPVSALADLPGFDTSAMDGWAISGPGPWQIVGSVLAGAQPGSGLQHGQAVEIATGAAVPDGASSVVRSEEGAVVGGVLAALPVNPRSHIRPRGEECRAGEPVAAAGTLVTPALAGFLAAAGLDLVNVRAVPRAALLLLGDELLDSGIPAVGQVRDSLGPQLPGWLNRLGARVDTVVRVPDTVPDLISALHAATGVDLIITTGGTAAGPVDCLHAALVGVGARLLVDSVAVRPGHPMVLAELSGTPVLGLPGNPQSAVVGLMTLGVPVVRGLLGMPDREPHTVVLSQAHSAPLHENRLVLGNAPQRRFTAADHLGSAMLRGLASATGLAVLPPGGAPAGETVEWLPLP